MDRARLHRRGRSALRIGRELLMCRRSRSGHTRCSKKLTAIQTGSQKWTCGAVADYSPLASPSQLVEGPRDLQAGFTPSGDKPFGNCIMQAPDLEFHLHMLAKVWVNCQQVIHRK